MPAPSGRADGASPGVGDTVEVVADVTQAVVALAMLAGAVALVAGLLEPMQHKNLIRSTTARFAAAAGGTRASAQQA